MTISRSPEELLELGNVDPEIDAVKCPDSSIYVLSDLILKNPKFPSPQIDYSDTTKAIHQLRALLAVWEKKVANPEISEWTTTYKTREGVELNLLVSRPASASPDTKLPVFIFYHGGGGSLGTPEGTAINTHEVVLKYNVVGIAPQYRLAPENPFPKGVDDAWDAFEYVARSSQSADVAKKLGGANPAKGLVVGGVSNGAVLTSIIALQAKTQSDAGRLAKITGLYFAAGGFVAPPTASTSGEEYSIPSSTLPAEYHDQYLSYKQPSCQNSPLLSLESKKAFDIALGAPQDHPLYRALNFAADPRDHAGLPRTYFQICGMDILRDDGFVYQDILKQQGVETKVDVYPGCPHIFWGVFPMVKQSSKWKTDTLNGLGWLFEKDRGGHVSL